MRLHRPTVPFRLVPLLLLLVVALAAAASRALADVHIPVVLNGARAASSVTTATTAQHYTGYGSWHELYPSSKQELYISPSADLGGASFTVGDIQSVTYHTYNHANASPVDYYLTLYTAGTAHGWYGQRITAEPYLKTVQPYTPVLDTWQTWSTSGADQLTFNDTNNSGNQGFYGQPTLAQVQAGPITWNGYPGNPTAGSSTPIDYASQGVLLVSIQTGSGWSAFDGYLDGISIALTNGTVYDIDLETNLYTLTASTSGSGTVTQSPSQASYADGSVVTLTATPAPDWHFTGWSGDLTGTTNPATLTMSANRSVTATFAPNTHVAVVLDRARAALSNTDVSLAQHQVGHGAWHEQYPSAKAELYISPSADLGGASFTIDDIQSMTYHTYNHGNAMPVDFYSTIYTVGTAHSWYGQKITAEPYLKTVQPYTPVLDTWQAWSTGGSDQLTFNDTNNSGNFGFYGQPTLAQLQAGPVTWNGYPGNPSGGSSTPIDYGSQGVLLLSFQTGSGWSAFDGYLDGITVTLNTGTTYDIDLEASPYTLTTNTVGSGSITKSPDQANYADGALVTLTAVPAACYTFTGWSGDASGSSNPLTLTMDSDKSVTATFALSTQTVTASAGAHGSISPSGTVPVVCGSSQSFSFTADPGYHVDDVLVDGISQGAMASYTFASVTSSRTIHVAFAQDEANVVTAEPPATCVTPAHACLTVPVNIARTNSPRNIRGWSATVTLSSNLQLCSGTGSVVEGSYLNSIGGTNFQVVDLGGNSYEVDCAILGAPCGATAVTGDLFTLDVTHTGSSGTGTITLTDVLLRDCANVPIVASAGSPASVTLDLTPVVVSAIPAQTIGETFLLTVTPSATMSGCAVGPLTWTATGMPSGATVSPGTGVFTWTPDCLGFQHGPSYGPVTLTATDAAGNSGSASFAITVTNTPGTVTVDPIAAQTVAETTLLTVTPSATFAGCTVGPLTWSMAGAPSGASIVPSTGVFTWTPDCLAFQTSPTYGPVTLTATATTGETGSANFMITVTNTPGTVTVDPIVDQTIAETVLLTVTPSASVTGCATAPFTWSATGLPGGASIAPATGVITWTPDCLAFQNGPTYGPIVVTATASSGETGSTSFHIAVTNTLGTVSVAAIAGQTVAEGSLLTVTPVPTVTGCAAPPLAWTATGVPSGASVNPSTGVFTWTPGCHAFEDGPLYGPVTLTATAATGEAGSASFSITVTNVVNTVATVTGLAAAQNTTGNDTDGTTKITLTFTAPPATTVEVFRAPYGNYPEYDDAPGSGSVPVAPSYPPSAPWTLTSVTASGQTDEPATRDVWYYVAFAHNACGDVSAVSSMTTGTLDYHLGDVTNGILAGQGNNAVNTSDISLLGAHYGITLVANDPFDYLDVGPTTTTAVSGRPTTDNRLQFEDLILFAVNFGMVAAPVHAGPTAIVPSHDALTVKVPALPQVGETFTVAVELEAAGDLQGLTAQLGFDASVVEQVSVSDGALLARQDLPGMALSSQPGNVDVALLGSGSALTGSGTVATMTFRVVGRGDAGFRILAAEGRNADNQPVALATATDIAAPAAHVPDVTYLGHATPNPVVQATTIAFGLHESGAVRLALFDVSGRLVRTLLDGAQDAGDKSVVWNRTDNNGRPVSSGIYLARLVANGKVYRQTIQVVR